MLSELDAAKRLGLGTVYTLRLMVLERSIEPSGYDDRGKPVYSEETIQEFLERHNGNR